MKDANPLSTEETTREKQLFKKRARIDLNGEPNAQFVRAMRALSAQLNRLYGEDYLQDNAIYAVIAVSITIIAIIVAATQSVN